MGKPLCCQEASGSEKTGASTEAEDVMRKLHASHLASDPDLPVCPTDASCVFDVRSIRGEEVEVCIDEQSTLPVDKVCCDEMVRKALKTKEQAFIACHAVDEVTCSDADRFKANRHEHPNLPSDWLCQKMYYCVGPAKELFGPVHSPAMCLKKNTGLAENRPAEAFCGAVSVKT